jgi:hypothetical protein
MAYPKPANPSSGLKRGLSQLGEEIGAISLVAAAIGAIVFVAYHTAHVRNVTKFSDKPLVHLTASVR